MNHRTRVVLTMIVDLVTLVLSVAAEYFLYAFLKMDYEHLDEKSGLVAALGFVIFGMLGMIWFKSYRSIYAEDYLFDIARSVAGYAVGEAVLIILVSLYGSSDILRYSVSVSIIGLLLISVQRVILFAALRSIRFAVNRHNFPNALIIGAGVAGRTVLSEINRSIDHHYNVVGFVDDDEAKISKYIGGVKVFGPIVLTPELCVKYKIDELIFAIPTCPQERKNTILNICGSTGCKVSVVPSLFDLQKDEKFLPQIVSINVEDLLGRDVIKLNNKDTQDFIKDRVVLVTGVGSIGSELCRQIVKFSPKHLVMVDIYENNAYEIQQELIRDGYGDIISAEIASVRDIEKMRALFNEYKPEIIFHAAAHKHVPLMETNPEEAVKNNICGTFNVARLANEFNCKRMVLISTDKAVNPTNVMGASKRCCEMIMQYMAQTTSGTEFAAVRFGNVLGSNGSVIPLFSKQIEAGGPVTVTHPDIIRYFMTIPEAVSLVLDAGTMAHNGEIFVLDMGEPVKIVTLAENLIRLYGYEPYTEMPITFVGLRPGEKLFEELLMSEEGLKSTANKKIFIGNQIEIDIEKFKKQIEKISDTANKNDKESVVEMLAEIVPTFHHAVTEKTNA